MKLLGKNVGSSIFEVYTDKLKNFDHFESNFLVLHIIQGHLTVSISDKEKNFKENSFIFVNRNYLAKLTMTPKVGGFFKAIYVVLSKTFLQNLPFTELEDLTVDKNENINFSDKELPSDNILLKELFKYFESTLDQNYTFDIKMEEFKLLETVLVLIRIDNKFASYLFSFSNFEKIDLNEFMNKNFRFNVPLSRFAELSGRSLSAFKRDFQIEFKTTPFKWLLNKRLSEAYHLLRYGKRPNEIYLDLGFENFSHFSKTFKKKFNISPSSVNSQASNLYPNK